MCRACDFLSDHQNIFPKELMNMEIVNLVMGIVRMYSNDSTPEDVSAIGVALTMELLALKFELEEKNENEKDNETEHQYAGKH